MGNLDAPLRNTRLAVALLPVLILAASAIASPEEQASAASISAATTWAEALEAPTMLSFQALDRGLTSGLAGAKKKKSALKKKLPSKKKLNFLERRKKKQKQLARRERKRQVDSMSKDAVDAMFNEHIRQLKKSVRDWKKSLSPVQRGRLGKYRANSFRVKIIAGEVCFKIMSGDGLGKCVQDGNCRRAQQVSKLRTKPFSVAKRRYRQMGLKTAGTVCCPCGHPDPSSYLGRKLLRIRAHLDTNVTIPIFNYRLVWGQSAMATCMKTKCAGTASSSSASSIATSSVS